ncbi:C1 family peptidase [Tannerella forsythia]|uniref:aminopeptidase C n=1 Tax=Tannerella forsythia TaxID=28112 RepID=UPI00062AF2B0|nr:C1 family peptidase [Tannerella forsythia]KKY60294.1 aminopeptidase [Tannerella forsythia]
MMRKCITCSMVLFASFSAMYGQEGQKEEGYQFTTVKEVKITPVKNQNRTGTCWSFSGVGLIEAELLRTGKGEYNLSEMFIANHSYKDKADKFVRLHGKLNFAQGGSFADVIYVFKHYGAVPGELYKGLEYGQDNHVHGELAEVATAYVNAVIKNRDKKLSTAWKKGFDGVIDTYLGKLPETFTYQGKQYTPKSFGESLGLNFDDYVSLTSYTHHPFYSQFPLEIEDNWRWAPSYNLPIHELMEVLDHAINNGYTIAWGSDVSEKGFTRNGIAVAADIEALESSGSDQARWVGLSQTERDAEVKKLVEKPCKEIEVTQELRQQAYDNYQTTDDHGMLIYGIAKDQTGKKFYMVKNSWGTESKYKGHWYASEAYVAYKTMNIVLHKDALPKTIQSKLGIK